MSTANASARRDPRSIRDKANIQLCIQTLEQFLINNNFTFTNKTLTNPSAKDVQAIFKFLFSFIDSTIEYTTRFEDDVIALLKGLKYPFISEINRSQFIAVTPHSWPVILAMFSWIIELASFLHLKPANSLSLNSLFYEHVNDGYQRFLSGDAEIDDEVFKKKVFEMYQGIFSEIDKRVALLKEIEEKIDGVGDEDFEMSDMGKMSRKDFLISKRTEVMNDIKSLATRKKQLEEKRKKYEMLNDKLRMANEELEEELTLLKKEITNLKGEIHAQKINPDDIREMNKEKIEMYTEIEKLKPQRENLIKQVNESEKILNEHIDAVEKLIFDLKSLRHGDIPFQLRKVNNEFRLDGDFKDFDRLVNNSTVVSEEMVNDVDLTLSSLEMKNSEYEIVLRELKGNIKHLDEKLITLGKLYLEKKSLHEIQQRKSKGELNKIEGELIKLDLESNHSLLVSEQRLQMARIQYEKMINTIKRDMEEIEAEILSLTRFLTEKKNEMALIINRDVLP